MAQYSSPNAVDVALTVVVTAIFMVVFVRVGLIAATCFMIVFITIGASPPLVFSQWYAGRAMTGLLVLLVYGFWVSLGSQPKLGSAFKEVQK